jgi:2-polyprenyl-3-methyl-5-hydroxy-6-metoxy-1,4-benzoquinol methylase
MSKICKCILCKSSSVRKIQEVSIKDLEELYFNSFNVDITCELINLNKINYYKCENCKLAFFDPIAAGSDIFYEDLQNKRNNYYSSVRNEFLYAKNNINRESHILEIGAGNGFFAELINADNYIGLEFNDNAIKDAQLKGISLIKKNIECFSQETKLNFDIVCSFHVLEHVSNPNSFIESAIKVLKKGGKLIIAVPCNNSIYSNNVNHTLNLPPHHVNRFFIDTMKKIAILFDLNLLDYRIDSIGIGIDKKHYMTEFITHKIINLFYPKNKLIINKKKYDQIRIVVHKFNNKFKLYKFFNDNLVFAENMTFIFEKK